MLPVYVTWMHRAWALPGIRPVRLNMAVAPSLSVRSTVALLTVLAMLSFWATKAARDEVTTSNATRMKVSAKAASCTTRLLSERPPRWPGPAGWRREAFMPAPSASAVRYLSDYSGPPRRGDAEPPTGLRCGGLSLVDREESAAGRGSPAPRRDRPRRGRRSRCRRRSPAVHPSG